jgi:hypothetical protein
MKNAEQKLEQRRRIARELERERLTRFICRFCKDANKTADTHPGVQHLPGICDCPCR